MGEKTALNTQRWLAGLVALGLGLAASSGWAQSQLPAAAEPGTLQRDFINRQDQAAPGPKTVTPPTPQVNAPAGAEKLKLNLTGITLSGNTVFTDRQLAELYTPLLGQTITLAEVYGIAQRITQKYQEAGYILSVATLPPQEVEGGVVQIKITEAYVADLQVVGENLSPTLLEKFRIRAQAENPLRKETVEELMLLLGNLPGASVTPVLIPGGAPGAVRLEVAMTVQPYQLQAGVGNRGSRFTGPFRQNASVTFNNLPHFASLRLAAETALPHTELKMYSLAYTLPLDAYGNSLELGGVMTRAVPGFTLTPLEVESESETFHLRWQGFGALTADFSSRWQLTLEHTGATSTILGALNADDDLRVVEVAWSAHQRQSSGAQTLGRVALRQGLDIFGASEAGDAALSRQAGRPDFTSLKFDLQHWQPLALPGWGLLWGLTGQYAGAQLLASEEFSWGGGAFGRAYDVAEFTGDHGLGTSLELSYTQPTDGQGYHQVFAFADLGAAWKINTNQLNDRKSAMSAGLGWRAQWNQHLSSQLELAKPLTRPSSHATLEADSARVFLGVRYQY